MFIDYTDFILTSTEFKVVAVFSVSDAFGDEPFLKNTKTPFVICDMT